MPLLRILMLMNTVADTEWLAHRLHCIGFELIVMHATTEATYSTALESPQDLIVFDTALWAFDALRAMQLLHASTQDIPLIVLTDAVGEAVAIACLSQGADAYLIKDQLAPLGPVVLRALEYRALRARVRVADAALHTSTAINQTVLDSLTTHIAVLNADGVIIAVNQAWERFARANGDADGLHTGVGVNYLEVCQRVAGDMGTEARFVAQRIAAVLLRDLDQFTIEYPCHSPTEERWFLLRVTPLAGEQTGAVVAHENITERKRVEEALRESEKRFRSAYDSAAIGMALVGLDGRWLQVNHALCAFTGYTEHELLATTVQALTHPDDLALDLANVRTLVAGETPSYQLEKRYFHKQGSTIWVLLSVSLVRDAQHQPHSFVAQIQDITERKHAEDRLRAAEAQYRTLVEQMPAIIYTAAIDAQSSTLYVSPQIETMLGFSPDEWLARPDLWLEQVHPDDRARVLESVDRAQASGAPVPLDYRTYTRDGRLIWMRDAARVVRDTTGQPLFMQGISLDITEQKLAEEALHASEQQYRTLASNFPNGAVVLFDHQLRFTIAGGTGLADLGLTPAQLEGHTLWEIYPPEVCRVNEPIFRAALAGASTIREITAGGQTMLMHTLPVRDVQGTIIAGMLMSQDITERKRMEMALIDERTLLEQRVAARTAELHAANTELLRAARLKDEFLATMSHELRTPLTAVLGIAEAFQEEIYGPLTERQRMSLHRIAESGQHLLDLINDILDVAKIGAGTLTLAIEPVNLAALCQASLRLVQETARKQQLAVDVTIDPAVTVLSVDARRLKQILVNLLSNAVKFTPAGGAIGLTVVGDAHRQVVDLTVWDTGIGIAPADLGRLFQPFIQLDSRLARQYNGTGLGLTLVARMAELHGGSVRVASEVGVGSHFTVSLPWHDGGVQNAVRGVSALPIALESLPMRSVILLAEDNETTSGIFTDYLEAQGYQIVIARTGIEAVAQAQATLPALILMDIQMPEMNGLEAIQIIRSQNRGRYTPIIALTALAMPGDRERCLAAGANAFLSKPVSLKALAAMIAEQLRNATDLLRAIVDFEI